MALIDKIRRSGINGRSVLTGPSQLQRPVSSGGKRIGSKFMLTGQYDQYEVGTIAVGATAGTYIVTLKPSPQNGLRATLRAVGELLVVKQAGGVAAPTTASFNLVGRKKFTTDATPIQVSGVSIATGDRLLILVGLKGSSTVRYDMEVDRS